MGWTYVVVFMVERKERLRLSGESGRMKEGFRPIDMMQVIGDATLSEDISASVRPDLAHDLEMTREIANGFLLDDVMRKDVYEPVVPGLRRVELRLMAKGGRVDGEAQYIARSYAHRFRFDNATDRNGCKLNRPDALRDLHRRLSERLLQDGMRDMASKVKILMHSNDRDGNLVCTSSGSVLPAPHRSAYPYVEIIAEDVPCDQLKALMHAMNDIAVCARLMYEVPQLRG